MPNLSNFACPSIYAFVCESQIQGYSFLGLLNVVCLIAFVILGGPKARLQLIHIYYVNCDPTFCPPNIYKLIYVIIPFFALSSVDRELVIGR